MGERTPHVDPNCRGVFFGLSASHTRADTIRAVLEGVSYSLAEALGVLKDMGVSPESMLVCGGGAKSALWRQMLADIYGCGVSAAGGEGAALGAALLAGVGAGVYPSVEKAAEAAVTLGKSQAPIAGNTEKYRRYFDMYRSLYPVLKERFAALSEM
jgi:xylulokinase